MKDDSEKVAIQPRKPYSKPEIRRVALRPEEAVLGNCKTAVSVGVAQATCEGMVVPCISVGS